MEVNADEMVINSDSKVEMLADIKETLERLRVINLKFDPKKCSFGVEEGKFSEHLIKKQRIKADPSKVKAISYLQPPKSVIKIQSLGKKLAAINYDLMDNRSRRSLSKNERALEALPTVTAPVNGETLIVYLAASEEIISAVLMAERGKNKFLCISFEFETTNNEAEYEALLAGLRIAKEMKIQELITFIDSQLVAKKFNRLLEAREPVIKQYMEKEKELLVSFPTYSIEHIKRDQNKKADALSKLASMTFSKLAKEVLVEVL
ncbi:reverse transcriptase domain-containing protein [Tanacetum coccineum]